MLRMIIVKRWHRPDFWPIVVNFATGYGRPATWGEARAYMRSGVTFAPRNMLYDKGARRYVRAEMFLRFFD